MHLLHFRHIITDAVSFTSEKCSMLVFFRKVILMSDFDYNSDEFEHNIDDPDPVVESSEGYEDLETPTNITPPPQQTIDISAENENNNSQNEEANVNDTADDESDSDKDGLVFSSFSSTGRHQNNHFSNNINNCYQ